MRPPDNATPYASGDYDVNVRQTIPFYEEFHRQTIERIRLIHAQPRLWLDTGCGTGYLVRCALEAFPNTHFVLADPSAGMLSKARKQLQGFQQRVTFIELPTGTELNTALPNKPEVVTAIMCHHYRSPEKKKDITTSLYNLLAPAGLYITFENIRPNSPHATQLALEQWRLFQESQGRSPATVQAHLDRFDQDYFPIAIEEHLKLLKDCGFTEAHLLWHSYMQAGFYSIKGN